MWFWIQINSVISPCTYTGSDVSGRINHSFPLEIAVFSEKK
jgi:hypothetical protein